MYCPRCGTKNRDDASYCDNCGLKLSGINVKDTDDGVNDAKTKDASIENETVETENTVSDLNLADKQPDHDIKEVTDVRIWNWHRVYWSVLSIINIIAIYLNMLALMGTYEELNGYGKAYVILGCIIPVLISIVRPCRFDYTYHAYKLCLGYFRAVIAINVIAYLILVGAVSGATGNEAAVIIVIIINIAFIVYYKKNKDYFNKPKPSSSFRISDILLLLTCVFLFIAFLAGITD